MTSVAGLNFTRSGRLALNLPSLQPSTGRDDDDFIQ